jgi:uncharacterized protein
VIFSVVEPQSFEGTKRFSETKAVAQLQPVQPNERIPELDIIRGFALFGVLMAYAIWNLGTPAEETYSKLDVALDIALTVLVDSKFYTIFACLFGLGFSVQLTRAEARGGSVVRVYSRRLLVLALIGLAHALLLRNGDILVPYAVTGLFLLLFRKASNRTLLIVALVGLVFPTLSQSAWTFAGLSLPQRPNSTGASYLVENAAWVKYWYKSAIFYWPGSLPMFMFGLYLGRRRLFEHYDLYPRELRRFMFAGLATGLVMFAIRFPIFFKFGPVRILTLLYSPHAWGMATFYVCALLLIMRRSSAWRRRLAPLGAVGRMALTNYLLQAVILVPVCLLFNLMGAIKPWMGVALALGVWVVQVPASVWWLRRFYFGPAEWIWRSLTYGQAQPFRRASQLAPRNVSWAQAPSI